MRTTDGYALDTENVSIDLKTRRAVSRSAVRGRMPLGSFTAGRLSTDLREHVVVLDRRARLHIVQQRAR
jgi:lipopolysaccharide export system protein LptC